MSDLKPVEKIWHPYWKWECYPAGFFENAPEGKSLKEGETGYRDFFETPHAFEKGIIEVFKEWPKSCEHNLTSPSLNKIAWLGQAAACITRHIPAKCRAGFRLLDAEKQMEMNELSKKYILQWYKDRNYEPFEDL